MDFLEKVCGEQKSSCGPLGRIIHKTINETELKAIEEARFPVPTSAVPIFPRYKQGEVSLSAAMTHNSRNNSCFDDKHTCTYFTSSRIIRVYSKVLFYQWCSSCYCIFI